jgi:hypothetical protein
MENQNDVVASRLSVKLAYLTKWQMWAIKMTDKGAGLDASPGAMTNTERKECDALVEAGLLRKALNNSGDKYGMYIKAPNVKVRGCALAQSQRSELDRRVRHCCPR